MKGLDLYSVDLVELVLDLLGRLLGDQGHDDRDDQRQRKAEHERVQTGGFIECLTAEGNVVPQDNGRKARDHTRDCARKVETLPEQGQQNDWTERRAEASPRVGYQIHDRGLGVKRDDEGDDSDDDDGDPADVQRALFRRLLVDNALVHILGYGGRGDQQLAVSGTHDRGKDTAQEDAADKDKDHVAGEDLLNRLDEYDLGFARSDKVLIEKASRDQTEEGRGAQGQNDPYDGDDAALLDLFIALDRHEANEDMRHTEVTQRPAEVGNDGYKGDRVALAVLHQAHKARGIGNAL